jgi:NAD(P)-dependent dehydrogenase (short-subunit alcohol dehydrogenase family)
MKIDRTTVAVITGAASGIGRALALRLADAGASLALADVNEAGLQETAELVNPSGVKSTRHLVDVSDEARMQAFVEEVTSAHGRANLVINNAGVALHGTVEQLSTAEISWLMGINFWGVIYGTKYFLPVLQQQPAAHLVNISSVFGIIGFPGQSAYNASKFAVRGFTEALRHELEGSTVRVSCVHPGGIQTNIARQARASENFDPREIATQIANFDKSTPTTPAQAAERIVRGIERNEPRILIGRDAWLIDRLQRWLPVSYWRVFRPLMERKINR